MRTRLAEFARSFKREFDVYRRVLRHPRTPWAAKLLLGLAVGYLLLPFDLIPDFLPVVGQLDDALIVPGLVWLAVRLVPAGVVAECRAAAGGYAVGEGRPAERGRGAMSRYLLIVLFLIVLVSPFVLRAALTSGDATATPAAGAQRLVIVTPHNQDIRREFERAFSRWHREKYGTPVAIDYRAAGGTVDIKRLLDKTYGALRDADGKLPPEADVSPDIDMVWGGGDYTFDQELKPLGVLKPVELPAGLLADVFPDPTLAGVRLYDYDKSVPIDAQRPAWVGVCLSSFGIVYNPDVVAAVGDAEPTTWADLADPRLAGRVALADPTHSGSAAATYMVIVQRAMADAEAAYLGGGGSKDNPGYADAVARGWHDGQGVLLRMAANSRYFTDGASQVPNDVANGDAAAGLAIDFYGRVNQELLGDDRIRFVSPRGATAITPDPIAVLYGVKGERLEVATRFVEFLLSPEGQTLWIAKPGAYPAPVDRSLRRPPIRRSMYAGDKSGWADDVDYYGDAGGFNQRGEWMATFSLSRSMWAAAWIDARGALKEAYGRVVSVPDAARRDALLAELADVPVTMQELLDLRSATKLQEKRAKSGDLSPADAAALADLLRSLGVPAGADLTSDEWQARRRIGTAERFREHYRAVAAKV